MAAAGIVLSSLVAMVVAVVLAIFTDMSAWHLFLAYMLIALIVFWGLILWVSLLPHRPQTGNDAQRPGPPHRNPGLTVAKAATSRDRKNAGSFDAMAPVLGGHGSSWQRGIGSSGPRPRPMVVAGSAYWVGGCFAQDGGRKPEET